MSDSNTPDSLDGRHERNRQQRIEGIKRWVDYITSEPPEIWGPQQNAVVDDQLESAQNVRVSADHRQRVEDVASEIVEASEDASDSPE
jgi:hypothetical protein